MTFLNATQHRGFAVARAGRTLSSPFTAVILDGNRGLRTTPPNSFCRIDATTRVRPTHANADTLRKIENKFQAQLLCYRLHNWQQVSVETWDAPGLCGSTRALASVVGSCFPNKRAIQARTIELLTPQDEARKFDTACGEPAVVLDALLVLCHENKQEVHVGELTDPAIEILNVRGDRHQLLPRRVGAILKPFRLGHARDNGATNSC